MSFLVFIAAFGEENNQEIVDNYDTDVDDDYDDASTFASLIFIAAFGECRCEVGARAGVLLHQLRPHFLLES